MGGVQEYLIEQEVKAMKQLAEIVICKAIPTMLDVAIGMVKWMEQSNGKRKGEVSLQQLLKHGEKLSEIPLNSKNVKAFTHIARKHGVQFSMAKDEAKTPPRHTVMFKAKDTETMTAIFKEYVTGEINKGKTNEKTFKQRLSDAKEKATATNKERNMKREKEGR